MQQLFVILNSIITLYSYGLIVYIFMSWFPGARESAFGQFLARISEPYLEQFRKIIPPIGMIDISPIAAIIVLHLARQGLAVLLLG